MPADQQTEAPQATETPQPVTPAAEQTQAEPMSFMDALDKALEGADKPKEKAPDAAPEVKPTEEKKAGDPAEDAEVKNMTPNAGAKFKEIKAEAKAARARVAELEAKLAETEKIAAKPDVAESEKLQAAIAEKEAKLAEYEKELAIVSFEKTAEYKEMVLSPMAAILGVVERLSKTYEVPTKSILRVLEEGDTDAQGDQITELAGSFSERDRVSLYTLSDDYSAILSQRDDLRARSAQALETRDKQASAAAIAAAEKEKQDWTSTANKVWTTIKEKIPLPTDPAERAKIEADVVAQVTGTDFNKMPSDMKAFASFSGALVPVVVKQNKALTAEVAELKQALEKYKTATPGAAVGGTAKVGEIDSNISFLDAIEKRFSGM